MVGYTLPYIVKKIKILDIDYQIFINKSIVKDLEKERLKQLEKVKTLQK